MRMSTIKGSIVILDFGGQYAHLISSRVRRLGAFTQILEPETSAELLKDAAGIILSGGPQSVYDENSPKANPKIFDLGIPVLGICYGLQYITKVLGGEVSQGKVKEYGSAKLSIENTDVQITKDLPNEITVWMSHGDEATRLPEGFERFGTSDSCANAAFAIELIAYDLGLSSSWVGAFDNEALHRDFDIPENMDPEIILTLGYADEVKKPSNRNDLKYITFFEKWGEKFAQVPSHLDQFKEFTNIKKHIKKLKKK